MAKTTATALFHVAKKTNTGTATIVATKSSRMQRS